MTDRDRQDEVAELADELGVSRSEARRLISTDGVERARKRRENREHRLPERAIPYEDDKETR
jgi:hypothetical protein